MSMLMFYVVIFSPAQPLRVGGDVTKCLLKAGKKVKGVGSQGELGTVLLWHLNSKALDNHPKPGHCPPSTLLVLQASR